MERRKTSVTKASPLPVDYLKMVTEVFATNFDSGFKIYEQYCPNAYFEAHGEIASNEVILSVSLMNQGRLAATTVYASADFDAKASSPSVQDVLAACLDGAGAVFATLLAPENPEMIERLSDESLNFIENIPFEWTEIEADKRRIFVKVDKSNPSLDQIAESWLKKHDPSLKKQQIDDELATENLFITGPNSKKRDNSSDH